MSRLQHYIELCYLLGGLVWAFDAWRMFRFQMHREMKLRDYAKALALLAAAPVTLVLLMRLAYRD